MRRTQAYPQSSSRQSNARYITFAVLAAFGFLLLRSFTKKNPEVTEVVSGVREDHTVLLSDLIAVGLGLTEQAARIIKDVKQSHKEHVHVKGLTAEGVDEPVTDADSQSNAVFVNGYRNHFPGIAMLSEETEPAQDVTVQSKLPKLSSALMADGDRVLQLEDVLVLVDPLDATKEFTEELLQYVTTMVCVVYKGEPIAGIINQVFESTPAVWAVVGQESSGSSGSVHGRPHWRAAEGAAAKTVTISRSHTGAGKDIVTTKFPGYSALLAGGSGYKALLVLDGAAAGYVHVTKIKSWDVCAADAVLRAVGGEFTDIHGKHLKYKANAPAFSSGIVATQSKHWHSQFLEKLEGSLQ